MNKRTVKNGHLQMVRNLNAQKILSAVIKSDAASRIELSRITGLSPTTVTNIVEKLIENRWLLEGEAGASNGGRKPILITLNRESRYVLCVQVSQKAVTGAVYNLVPAEVYRIARPLFSMGGAILEVLMEVIGELVSYADGRGLDVLALGLATPGIVDSQSGTLVFASDFELEDIRLKEMIEQRFPITAYIYNDANVAALAEITYGVAVSESMMIYVKDLGGGGIVMDGDIYLGCGGVAGEFGHISIDRHGERCKCGNYGCLYQYVSRTAIESNAIKEMKSGAETSLKCDYNSVTLELIIEAANAGDPLCRRLVLDAARNFGIGVVTLVNILDIRFIVVGGPFAKAGDYFYREVADVFGARTSKMAIQGVKIARSTLGEDAGLLGCVCVVLKETFKSQIV